MIRRVSAALDVRVDLVARWRAGDLDRLLNAKHSQLHELVARWFAFELPQWILAPEVSYAIHRERGVIDIVAWHPGRRAILVIELKTDIVDVNQLIGKVDEKARLIRQIVRYRGWDPLTVSTWVIVAAGRTNRARLAAHRSVLRAAFPSDGRAIRGWLHDPVGQVRRCRSGTTCPKSDLLRPGASGGRPRVASGGRPSAGYLGYGRSALRAWVDRLADRRRPRGSCLLRR